MKIGIIAGKGAASEALRSGLIGEGFECVLYPPEGEALVQIRQQRPSLVLLELGSEQARELAHEIRKIRDLSLIALVPRSAVESLNGSLQNVDDFILQPCDIVELGLRVARILQKSNNSEREEIIKHGDLVIDLARCEVFLRGEAVILTYREYALLKFLASNSGRTFTRDKLLDRVWGYDYYGGDRTVDVHVRRLRCKIEDIDDSYIETVRNIGYRFHKDLQTKTLA
ncbi:response regulator transcription factor [Chloroflexota bacterium]